MSREGPVGVRPTAAVLVVLLAAAIAPGVGGQASASGFADVGQIEPDTVVLDVSLQPDGDARWSIRYRVRLDDDNATAAFDSLEQDVRENRSAYTSQFEERIGATVRAAENATGRDMAVRNVSVRTNRQEIPQQYGVLIYEFEWTNFAEGDGSTIRAGDAIGGLFLDGSTSITIRWPEGYGVVSADPSPDDSGDSSVTWRGPRDFATDRPRLVLSTAAGTTGAGSGPGASSGGLPTWLLALGVLAVVMAVAGAGLWWRRRQPGDSDSTPASAGDAPPEELLSNEERVLRLLEERGGRMKQQQVVEELGWTDAKTSQVVGALREAGQIEVFRLGRENVLDLSSEEEAGGDR